MLLQGSSDAHQLQLIVQLVRPYLPISRYISLDLAISRYISLYLQLIVQLVRPYLPISPYISLYLPRSPYISLHLPTSPYIYSASCSGLACRGTR